MLYFRFIQHPNNIVKGQRGARPGVPHHPRIKREIVTKKCATKETSPSSDPCNVMSDTTSETYKEEEEKEENRLVIDVPERTETTAINSSVPNCDPTQILTEVAQFNLKHSENSLKYEIINDPKTLNTTHSKTLTVL